MNALHPVQEDCTNQYSRGELKDECIASCTGRSSVKVTVLKTILEESVNMKALNNIMEESVKVTAVQTEAVSYGPPLLAHD